MKLLTMFKETEGSYSMRRICAFFFTVAGIVGGIIATIAGVDWKIVTAAFGVPGGLSLSFLILTTVSDVKEIVSAAKDLKS